jgi:RNA polymerase sigma factor (sigma-70 family)
MQDTFLKAFQHIGSFQRRSKFSTWLLTIANNTGLQRLRDREPVESLDDAGTETEEDFRPRQIRTWADNPEQLYSAAERRQLVEQGMLRLPAKYRVVLVLRDIEQLSTEEAATALGLGIPAIKSRLGRARLMLREALAPHFIITSQSELTRIGLWVGDMEVQNRLVLFFVAIILASIYAKKWRVAMSDSLPQLEAKRAALFRQLAAVGDFRRGSISSTSGKCGKPNCHCSKPDACGHGPNFRLTRRVEGKTVTETFASPAAMRKAQQEVTEFHRFQELCAEILGVSETICALRPVEDTLTPQEKKRPKRSTRRSRGM